MYVLIGTEEYHEISNLVFAPQTDVAGTQIPVNEFECDIYTHDRVRNGEDARLYDDLDNLWAHYWIVYAGRVDGERIHIRAQSRIALLERVTMPAVMYSAEPALDVLDAIFSSLGGRNAYAPDASLQTLTLTGFCPEQSARDRLLWVCFVARAYVQTYFTETIAIKVISDSEITVPMDKTYYKPTVSYDDTVTAVRVTAYSFTSGTPQTTDEYVTDGTSYWIVRKTPMVLSNPAAPVTAPENVVAVDNVMLVTTGNADDILTHLSKYYFEPMRVSLSVIDNAEYMPGQKLLISRDDSSMAVGYVQQCNFSFGVQAKADIELAAASDRGSGNLVIKYMDGRVQIGMCVFLFPVGYQYSVLNPYLTYSVPGHRYIYRPLNEYATGTVVAGKTIDTQPCAVALDLYTETRVLHVISVDAVEVTTSQDITIGEIA